MGVKVVIEMGIVVPLLSAFVLGQIARDYSFDTTYDIRIASMYYKQVLKSGTFRFVLPAILVLFGIFICRDFVQDVGWQPMVILGCYILSAIYFHWWLKPYEEMVAWVKTLSVRN